MLGKKSVYGDVFTVCREKNCDYVIKIMKTSDSDKIKKEICLQKICASRGLCQPDTDWWFCQGKTVGVIITPILKETLRQWNDREDHEDEEYWNMMKKTLSLILKLHKISIAHLDTHHSNFMLDKEGNMFFIDMGEAELLPKDRYYRNKKIEYDYSKFSDYVDIRLTEFVNSISSRSSEKDIIKRLMSVTYNKALDYQPIQGW